MDDCQRARAGSCLSGRLFLERRCFGHDVVSRRMRMLKSHSADSRFDIENEGTANNTANLRYPYAVCEQSARRANSKFRSHELKCFILARSVE